MAALYSHVYTMALLYHGQDYLLRGFKFLPSRNSMSFSLRYPALKGKQQGYKYHRFIGIPAFWSTVVYIILEWTVAHPLQCTVEYSSGQFLFLPIAGALPKLGTLRNLVF